MLLKAVNYKNNERSWKWVPYFIKFDVSEQLNNPKEGHAEENKWHYRLNSIDSWRLKRERTVVNLICTTNVEISSFWERQPSLKILLLLFLSLWEIIYGPPDFSNFFKNTQRHFFFAESHLEFTKCFSCPPS